VFGWCADLFRLYWGLVYWNVRKSWYRLRRDRAACPCQARSDSGLAFETQCDACLSWHHPARFRRVCPLLVATPAGLRCSVDAADVRPYWGRAALVGGGTLLGLYLAGVLVVFAFLRGVGYPVNVFHVALPPLWYRVVEARGWFFHHKSSLAFAEDRVAEGLLYLTNAYDFDPANYTIGLSLAKHLQSGQASRSDEVFQRLLRDHPEHRHATAQDWFRALLARGSFTRVAELARDELLTRSPQSAVWIRALVFACRQLPDDRLLQDLRSSASPALRPWQPVFEVESLLRQRRWPEVRARVDAPWVGTPPDFSLYYRASVLSELRDPFAALDLLDRQPGVLDGEAVLTLRLDALARGEMKRPLQQEIDRALALPITLQTLPIVKVLCAHLIRHPDAAAFDRLAQKVGREKLPLQTDSAGIWFSLFCTAGVVGDRARLHELTARLRNVSEKPFMALSTVEAFFRGQTAERRITTFLPLLPLPLEVTYALLERYPSSSAPASSRQP
jgi:hypothetical protein